MRHFFSTVNLSSFKCLPIEECTSNVLSKRRFYIYITYIYAKVLQETFYLQQQQRRRQRGRHKFAYLVAKNNISARPARAFSTFVHFFAVVCNTTTWNGQIWGFTKDFSTYIFSPELSTVPTSVILEGLPHPCHIKKVEIVTKWLQ